MRVSAIYQAFCSMALMPESRQWKPDVSAGDLSSEAVSDFFPAPQGIPV
jgi:hypothetical protein